MWRHDQGSYATVRRRDIFQPQLTGSEVSSQFSYGGVPIVCVVLFVVVDVGVDEKNVVMKVLVGCRGWSLGRNILLKVVSPFQKVRVGFVGDERGLSDIGEEEMVLATLGQLPPSSPHLLCGPQGLLPWVISLWGESDPASVDTSDMGQLHRE